MSTIVYAVTATLPDEATAREYVEWLLDGHVAGVIAGGAKTGCVVRIEEPAMPIRVETRYDFASREALGRYVEGAAPALRAEGLAKFGPARGVRFERVVGRIESAPGPNLD
jgi:hypothetical protein